MIHLIKEAHFYPLRGLEMDDVYAFYDQPVVYSAHNKENHLFVAMLIKDDHKSGEDWMLIPTTEKNLKEFNTNLIDLLTLINRTEEVHIIAENREGFTSNIKKVKVDSLTDKELPKKGFYADLEE